MRPILVAVGIVVALLGVGWSLQGAYLLPATFMRGPAWIAIGAVLALAGCVVTYLGLRRGPPVKVA